MGKIKKHRGRIENLIPDSQRTPEKLRENKRKGGIRSGQARREKKLMSQIYAEFLAKKHKIKMPDGKNKDITGAEMIGLVISTVFARGDSASVRLMREIREATEGIIATVHVETNYEEVADKIEKILGIDTGGKKDAE